MSGSEESPEFDRTVDAAYGASIAVSPLVTRVLAGNPSPFTFTGSASFLVGTSDLAVIDPGPEDDAHLDALIAAIGGRKVSAILVTHTHLDHSPLAARLSSLTGAPTYAFGRHGEGRTGGLAGESVEAGADLDFDPDHRLLDGDAVTGAGWTIKAVHTPGHTSNHLCFDLIEEQTLFTGDHVMGWSTSVISPPDGDMRAYMASLEKLMAREDRIYRPTHGAPVMKPQRFARALLGHRRQREQQIFACIADGIGLIPEMVARMYKDVGPRLHPAAARSVLAHIIRMVEDGELACEGDPGLKARYFSQEQ